MIEIKVNTNTLRTTVIAEPGDTVISVFDKLGVGVVGAMVNLNGTILNGNTLRSSFETLGYKDNDSVSLTSVVKADGGTF